MTYILKWTASYFWSSKFPLFSFHFSSILNLEHIFFFCIHYSVIHLNFYFQFYGKTNKQTNKNTHTLMVGGLVAKYKQIGLFLHANDHKNGTLQNFTIVPFFIDFIPFRNKSWEKHSKVTVFNANESLVLFIYGIPWMIIRFPYRFWNLVFSSLYDNNTQTVDRI